MFNKPIKTYLRKPAKLTSKLPSIPTVQFSDSDDQNDNGKIEDFDDTFDKLRKTARPLKPCSPTTVDLSSFDSSNDSEDSLEEIPIPEPLWKDSTKSRRKRKAIVNIKKEKIEKVSKLSKPKGKRKEKNTGKIIENSSELSKNEDEDIRKDKSLIQISSEGDDEHITEKIGIKTDEFRECHVRLSQLNVRHSHNLSSGADKSRIEPNNISNKIRRYGNFRAQSTGKKSHSNYQGSPDNVDNFVKSEMLKAMKKLDEQYLATLGSPKASIGSLSSASTASESQSSVEEQISKSQGGSMILENKTINSRDSSAFQSESESERASGIEEDSVTEVSHSLNENSEISMASMKKQSPSKIVTNDCSVLLKRLIKRPEAVGKKRTTLSVNNSLLSSTPLVSRLGARGTKLQLSPIVNKSLTISEGISSNNSTENEIKERENPGLNLGGSTVVINFSPKKKQSISIVDEDTELVSSHQSSLSTEDSVKNSLKERIEKELFSSDKNQTDSIEIIERLESSVEISENSGRNSRNSFESSNKENYSSNQVVIKDKKLEEKKPLSLSATCVSPLMFEDTEVEATDEREEVSDIKMNKLTIDGSSEMSRSISPLFSDDKTEETNESRDSMNNSVNKNEIIDPTLSKKISVLVTRLPDVLLTKLNDPTRVTDRRDRYKNWDNRLSAISEDCNRVGTVDDENDESVEVSQESLTQKVETEGRDKVCDDKVFLKPGKSYARSLSILNQMKNKNDLEALSVGKGQNWRHSVLTVLGMQNQGVVQSCIDKNENDKDESSSGGLSGENIPTKWSSHDGRSSQWSPGRFIRRVSIRVVPDNKSIKHIDKPLQDPSFLEAYGITTSKDRQTLVKKSITPPKKTNYNFRSSTNISKIHDPLVAAKNVVLERCNQTDSLPFSHFYSKNYLENCRKIGEGVYGEVFLFDNGKDKSVIKIIPIEGNELVNDEPQKKFNEILSEIIIAKELHNLRVNETYKTDGFVEVKSIRCLRGKYPQKLIELWNKYDEEKRSDNDCPSMFNEEQLYIALELGDGGKDLEEFVFQNASETHSLFIQIALTLAVAEKSLDFEHRDLHWGNILISRTNKKQTSYKLDHEKISFPCRGVAVSIIDFTLSRMSYQGCCIFNDLSLDPSLFTAQGEYQFEIYRLMRAKVGNEWQRFEPYTNILWLHYTLDKMINAVRYSRKSTKSHKNFISKMENLKDLVLDYDSAYNFVHNCENIRELLTINSTESLDKFGEPKSVPLREMFEAYCQLDAISDAMNVLLLPFSQLCIWLESAKIIDMIRVTKNDAFMCFFKFEKRAINYNEFLEYLDDLADEKDLDVDEMIHQMKTCGKPEIKMKNPPKRYN